MNQEAIERSFRRAVNWFCIGMLAMFGVLVILLLAAGLYAHALLAAAVGPLSVVPVYILNNWLRPLQRAWFDRQYARLERER